MSDKLPSFVHREDDFIEISSPEDVFTKPEPVLYGAGKPVTNVWDLLEICMRKYSDRNCMGVREAKRSKDHSLKFGDYMWITYGTLFELCEYAGSALASMGVKRNELCAVYGCNSPEFVISMFGCIRQGCIPVPLAYWTSSTQLAHMIRVMGLRVVMCNAYVLPRFVRACEILEREDVPLTVKAVVIVRSAPGGKDRLPEGYVEEQARRFNWRSVVAWDKFLATGKKHKKSPHPGSLDNIFGIFQTSGTTGESQAVALSNGSVLAGCDAICSHPALASIRPGDPLVEYNSLYFSYVGSFAFTLSVMRLGGCTGFPSYPYIKSDAMFDDIRALSPTHLNTTPEFIYMCIENSKEAKSEHNFFRHKRKRLGGRLAYVNLSSAFLTPVALEAAKTLLGCDIIQTYGQSEYFGCGLVTPKTSTDTTTERFKSTSSGVPMPGTVIRMVTVDDGSRFSITHNPPTGEMFIYSNSMFTAYLGDDEATLSVLDDDGWFRTGDVGQLNPDGSISIIARLKEDLKRSNGIFAQCSMMNQAYSLSTLCKHVFTYVRKDSSITVAVVEADVIALDDCAMLPSCAREISANVRQHPKSAAAKKMLAMPEIEELYLLEFARIAADNHFNPYEVIRGVILDNHEWTEENGLLTGSGKVCHVEILRKFQDHLDRLIDRLLEQHPEYSEPVPKEEPDLTLFE